MNIYLTTFDSLSATYCNTQAVVNGSPSFCVKKANFLLTSPRKSLALHPTVPLIHTLILTSTHTLTVVHSQKQKQHMLSTHFSGMSLEDKVSLLGRDLRLCRKPVAHILLGLSIEMEGSSLNPSSPASKNSVITRKWYKIRIDGPRGGELLPHRKSLFGFLKSLLHLSYMFSKDYTED